MAELTAARASTPAEWARAATRRLTKHRLRQLLFLLGPLLVLLAVGYFYFTGGRYVTTDDAYVQAETVNLSTDVSGIVAAVDVRENQKVAQGQELFRLDDEPFRLALATAEAQLRIVRDEIEAQEANYRKTVDAVNLAAANAAYYQTEFRRTQTLVGQNFASRQSFDKAQHDLATAASQLAQSRQELAGIVANLDGNPDIAVEQHPRYRAALAQVDLAKRNLRDTVVRASLAGIVTNVPSVTPGTYYTAGSTAFNLVAADHVWVTADAKETELTHVVAGQPVTVTVDTYPGVEFHGTVESLSPASASTFSLLPAENASGNWVKVVQRIPVRIRVDLQPGEPVLRDGMSVEVTVDTGRYRRMPEIISALFGGTEDGGGRAG